MLSVCQTEIVYRHELGRRPTEYDMKTGEGLYEFSEILRENGWCTRDDVFTKNLKIVHSAKEHDIEWRATVMI